MRILAIDPGSIESGYAEIELPEFRLVCFGKIDNDILADMLPALTEDVDIVAIEMVASYGMTVGKDVFETCVWVGKFEYILREKRTRRIYRADEKMEICYDSRAKDSNIRQALIDRYAKHDFRSGKGTKKNPDVFYGVANDAWQAVAVGVTCWELERKECKDE